MEFHILLKMNYVNNKELINKNNWPGCGCIGNLLVEPQWY